MIVITCFLLHHHAVAAAVASTGDRGSFEAQDERERRRSLEGVLDWRQARGVGGCGIHNAMIYIRGTPYDFNQGVWAENNWTWDQVLPFYTRTENNTYFESSSRHSNSGPVQISFASDLSTRP